MRKRSVTIATHNGRTVAVGHNQRDPAIVSHEPHIDPAGKYEIWHHEDLRDFYARTFGDAVAEHDGRVRADRRIGDYLTKLTEDAKGDKGGKKGTKAPVYEMIVGVYPQDGTTMTEAEQREILRAYVYGDDKHPGWADRNPGLQLVGVYYHADEPDAEPHLHIDYVPVAQMQRGMKVQNSLEKALNQSGYKSEMLQTGGKSKLQTAQQTWTAAENDTLQGICEAYGLDVQHPQRGKGSKHKSTAQKKHERELKAREDAVAAKEIQLHEREQAQIRVERAQEARRREMEAEAGRWATEWETALEGLRRATKAADDERALAGAIVKWAEANVPKVVDKMRGTLHKADAARQTSERVAAAVKKPRTSRELDKTYQAAEEETQRRKLPGSKQLG